MKNLTLAAALVAASSLIPVSCLAQEPESGDYGTPGYTGGGPRINPITTQKSTPYVPPPINSVRTLTGTARAIDGDTFDIAGRRSRLAGIDAPELSQTCTDETQRPAVIWHCGQKARERLQTILDDVQARRDGIERLVCEPEGIDRYQRSVMRCHLVFADQSTADISAQLVAAGYAVPYYKYGGAVYDPQYAEAKLQRRGMHRGTFEQPAAYRRK